MSGSEDSFDSELREELTKPDQWAELLEADADKPRFFKFVMSSQTLAQEVASDETAMEGVFSYDEN